MINAWVLYENLETSTIHFESRLGAAFDNDTPVDWGFPNNDDYYIILVLQNAQFIGAWIEGQQVQRIN